MGNNTTETMRLHETMKNEDIIILIDDGSTHYFIQDRIVKFLGLPNSHSTSFQVMVGSGEKLQCNTICHQVPITLANPLFSMDFFCLTNMWY